MKRVYQFEEGRADMRDLLGGKGANLAEMTNIGLPVPPGFTITTDACRDYMRNGSMDHELLSEIDGALAKVEQASGKQFGDPADPLLLSVRSGAKFSMPGMMDTVLNLGLNDETAQALIRLTDNPRFVYDAYRRFIMMFSDIVLDIGKKAFEEKFDELKSRLGAKADTDVPAEALRGLVEEFKTLVASKGHTFPQSPKDQLRLAIEAVFKSWNNERARVYRAKERISDEIGTACNVQAMVFGNMGDDSGTGVAFTRDPSTGENELYGEFLINAQGEDVVAGVRTPLHLDDLKSIMPDVYRQFAQIALQLEEHYRDMMDLEFTIERGKLFMLQCRAGKRTGRSAVKIAVDLVQEGRISIDEAIMRVPPAKLDELLHWQVDPEALKGGGYTELAKGLAASPGAGSGHAVFDAETALAWKESGRKVILVRPETNPDDLKGMLASVAILTARGGMTSHAAVVARGFGIPCVAGCEALAIDEEGRRFTAKGQTIQEGDVITVDGATGKVFLGDVPLVEPALTPEFLTLLGWAEERKRLGVRANADNPEDAAKAIEFGAKGIGLCRTEHMFFEDRLPIMREMILAKDETGRRAALDKLRPFQRDDFVGIFKAMSGYPVTVRLVDPPLHEFLPDHEELLREIIVMEVARSESPELETKKALLARVEKLKEANPMLGLRGVRLSIIHPEIVEMQVAAIIEAAILAKREGFDPKVEIMIPLVSHVNELRIVRDKLEDVAKQTMHGETVDYMFGTMIELPRAALTANEIAEYAEFFSFGTNDLTQTTFGFSRDDVEGKFMLQYLQDGILPENPFVSIDREGVGQLVRMACEKGRATRPNIKLGICGEHGGDPASVEFCHEAGLDYVSCSPYRVPIARLAAAQAALKSKVSVNEDK